MECSKEAIELISDVLENWYAISKDCRECVENNGIVFDSQAPIPTIWEIEDGLLETCIDYCIRSVWYSGVPLNVHEFVDCLESILDMEKIEYLGHKFEIKNSAQEILIEDLF